MRPADPHTSPLNMAAVAAGEVPPTADVVVIGAGLMGSAAAWSATRRGLSTVLLEQFELGHNRGSSHGSARIVRRACPDATYLRLTGQAMELWRELEADSGRALVKITGGLDYGSRRGPQYLASVLAEQDVPHELLKAAEATERWPGVTFQGPVLFHPQAGTVDAALAVGAAIECSQRRGAMVMAGTQVERVDVIDDQHVRVVTNRGTVRAGRLIVAAGSWIQQLLGDVVPMPELTVTQQQIFHFPRRNTTLDWPVIIHQGELDTYSLPGGRDGGPSGGRKVAESRGTTTTADARSGIVDPSARDRMIAYVQESLPGLIPEPFNETTCLYTSTANGDFVLDRVGAVVICSPCSGHGAKFAPLVGELVVDLATGAAEPPPRFTLAAHAATAMPVPAPFCNRFR